MVQKTDILDEIRKSFPSKIIDLYEADLNTVGSGFTDPRYNTDGILRIFNDSNTLKSGVNYIVWGGNTYYSIPMDIEGFEWSGGQLPTPKLSISNLDGIATQLNSLYNDLLGLKITRIRTLVKYLDAVNFISGINVTADPLSKYPDEVYYIDRKVMQNNVIVQYDLASSLDISSIKIPRRMVIQNICYWKYKEDSTCGYDPTLYNNRMFKADGTSTTDPFEDICGKRLSDCKARFNTPGEVTNILNYGGFPGAGLLN
jgi:lambda family phage minor tail protein L